ncbi:MAG: hypothetical protein IJA83_09350 [Clostridia bacterium]|nr:hypothetical protein [Clostridia bacterium]
MCIREWLMRLRQDRRFRIVSFAALSLGLNLLYSTAHCWLALWDGMVLMGVLAVYYVLLGVMRLGAVLAERRNTSEEAAMRLCGGLLMCLALVLGAATVISLKEERFSRHGMILMIAITAYTFFRLTMAIVHTVQAWKWGTPLTRTIRNISMADALVSLMTTQRSMLVSFESNMTEGAKLLLNALTSGGVILLVFLLGLNMFCGERWLHPGPKKKREDR